MKSYKKLTFSLIRYSLLAGVCLLTEMAWSSPTKEKGILLVHYGTTNEIRRESTLDVFNHEVAEKFADCLVIEAYTSSAVRKALARQGVTKLSVAEGWDRLRRVGCRDVVVQTTLLLEGVMMDGVRRDVEQSRHQFRDIQLARSLLYSLDDCRRMVFCLDRELQQREGGSVRQVVLVGHGSDTPSNAIYCQIDYLMKDEGRPTWHVGTIEGYPTIEQVKKGLILSDVRQVVIIPLLYIAGNHLYEDIDGEWRKELEQEGYQVSVWHIGLGELAETRRMLIQNINEMLTKYEH